MDEVYRAVLSGFDVDFYRRCNADLQALSETDLVDHYLHHGCAEGRLASPAALREKFLERISVSDSVLEIGPFCNPCAMGSNVSYFDVLNAAALLERAKCVGYPVRGNPHIDFVSPTGDLGIIDQQFDAVVSSHCIEHQPDLISHLQQVERILRSDGRYYLIIPDKRYCFDHYIAESNLAQILSSYLQKRRLHTEASVIEHRSLITHNDAGRHWAGDHFDPGWVDGVAFRAINALAELEASGLGYIDVHAWQFTPMSFASTINNLNKMNLINFKLETLSSTVCGRNEFTAVLFLGR